MAGLPSNNAWVGFSKQSAKGTPPASMQYKTPLTAGTAQPDREVAHLAETDTNVDQGETYVVRFGASGNPSVYARTALAGLLLTCALGTDTPSGVGPYVHAITPANTLPYLTVWRMVGGVLWERLNDCQISSLTLRASAGEPLVIEANFIGRNGLRLAAVPFSDVPAVDTQAPISYNEAAVTVGSAGAVSTVSGFELTIDNNLTMQQTDDAIVYDLARAGARTITLSYDMIFENINDYTAFHTNTTSGTAQSLLIYESVATFLFTRDANNAIQFSIPEFAWEEFPLEPDAGGAPLVVSVRGSAQRRAAGASIMTASVTNSVATYPGV